MSDDLVLEPSVSEWSPPEEVTLHNGEKIPDSMEFFASPPEEIGEVLTAWSSLGAGKAEMNSASRWLIRIGVAGACTTVGYYIGDALRGPADGPTQTFILAALGLLLGVLLAVIFTGFKHTCSFVGAAGFSEWTLKGSRSSEPVERRFLFADAVDLRTGQTRNYYNGVYTGTTYFYNWVNEAGKTVKNLNGTYSSKVGTPKAKSPYWLAASAENAWNMRLADQLQTELDKNGYVEFRVNKKDLVRVGPGFLEFVFSGKEERVPQSEIKDLSIHDGTFSIKTKEARWFSKQGKFGFNYGAMSNAKMFIFSLQRLLGYSFE
jgi:hypothetical protein